jgi:hypothetical protein
MHRSVETLVAAFDRRPSHGSGVAGSGREFLPPAPARTHADPSYWNVICSAPKVCSRP